MQNDSIKFFDAVRAMENATDPFSVSWCKHSADGEGGNIHTESNVLFSGKRVTEDYELIFFKRPDTQVVSCHLFSLMFFNGLQMTIQ